MQADVKSRGKKSKAMSGERYPGERGKFTSVHPVCLVSFDSVKY